MAIEALDGALDLIRSHKRRISVYGNRLQESLAELVAREDISTFRLFQTSSDAHQSAGLVRQQLVEVVDPSELTDAVELNAIPYELLCS